MSNNGEIPGSLDTVLVDIEVAASQTELKKEECNDSKGSVDQNSLVKINWLSDQPNSSPSPDINGLTNEKDPTEKARIQYSRVDLLKLMNVPASRQCPDYFDISFVKAQGTVDLDKWMKAKQEKGQIVTSSTSNGSSVPISTGTAATAATVTTSSGGNERPANLEVKKTKDPRERIKQEEQDGIVLSPQRRSFGTGCHVIQQGITNSSNVLSDIPVARGSARDSQRDMPSRRIGSGRILRRDEPEPLMDRRKDNNERDTDQRQHHHKDWRTKNEMKYDREERHDKRRRFFDDDDKRRDRRYNDHRRPHREEEAPEWFTGGPSSQNEYIELVGFDDQEEQKPKRERRRSKKERGENSRVNSRSTTPVIIEQEEPTSVEMEASKDHKHSNYLEQETPIVVEPPKEKETMNFNIDDILGDILNLATDDIVPHQNRTGSSRLKQFFTDRESPIQQHQDSNSRKSSLDTSSQFNSLLSGQCDQSGTKNGLSPNMSVDSSRFFAPISPANKTSGDAIADLFFQAKARKPMAGSGRLLPPSVKDLLMGGKGQSLEEIEAGMRTNSTASSNAGPMRPATNGSSQFNPFNDFLSQVTNGSANTVADNRNDCDNIFSKIMNEQMVNKKPAVPNNAPTESEIIARFIKNNNMNGYASRLNAPRLNGATQQSNLNVPPPPISHNVSPPGSIAPVSPSKARLQAHQDLLKSFQNRHMQNKLLHSNFHQQMQHPNLQQQQQQQQQQLQHHHQQQNLDPIKQLVGGINNISMNTPQESTLRVDIQNLFKRVRSGHVTDAQLIAQLNSGNLNSHQREIITSVIKILNNHHSGPLMPPRATLTPSPTPQMMGATPVSLSPRVASPNPDAAALLAHPYLANTRVSPSMFGGTNISGNAPRRPPSHHELVVHTQNILQNALLKQELVKAKEKHRKREADRGRSPNPMTMQNGSAVIVNKNAPEGSPTKGAKCQSPLAFTPTSVMRKMTAERDRIDKSDGIHHLDRGRDTMSMHGSQGVVPHTGNSFKVNNNPPVSSLGPMMLGGNDMRNIGVNQRHTMMPVGRPNVNNMRVQQPTSSQAALNQQQYMRAASNLHPRMANANPLQHLINNNYKPGEANLQVPYPSAHSSSRNSPVNLMNLLGRDIMAQVQAGPPMPELPGGKAMSLEEVERMHKSQAVTN